MESKKYKIIDTHTHVYPEVISKKATENLGNFYNFNVYGDGTLSDLKENARECGVDGFFLLCVATNPKQVQKVNDTLAENVRLSRQEGFEVAGFAGIHQDYENIPEEVERCISLGLNGIKIHPDIQEVDIDDQRLFSLYECCEGRFPVFFHMGDDREKYRFSEPKKLAKILDRFPKLEVIAAHFGGYKAWNEAKEYLYGRDNVWYDTSSALWAMTPEKAKELIGLCAEDKVMFGSDYPVMTIPQYLDLFMKIDLTEKQRCDILYNNCKRFLK